VKSLTFPTMKVVAGLPGIIGNFEQGYDSLVDN
jgi:hypothetical protein